MNRSTLHLMQMNSASFGMMPAPAQRSDASDLERPARRRRGDDPSRERVATLNLASPPRPVRRRGRALAAVIAVVALAAGVLV